MRELDFDTSTRFRRWLAIHAMEMKFESLARAFQRKFNPGQPRVPAGQPEGGQWTSDAGTTYQLVGGSATEVSVHSILSAAKELAASRASMNKCIALLLSFAGEVPAARKQSERIRFS